MQWFIIGRDMHVLCTPSTDLPQTLPIDDSGDSQGQEISITNNSPVGTYDFTTVPRHPDISRREIILRSGISMARIGCIQSCPSKEMKNGPFIVRILDWI